MRSFDGLPNWLIAEISACPPAGSGVNDWQFKVARLLTRHWSETEIYDFVRTQVQGCGRHVSEVETRRQVRRGIEASGGKSTLPGGSPSGPRWRKAPPRLTEEFAQKEPIRARDIANLSPIRILPIWTAGFYLSALFPGNPLICCGYYRKVDGETKPICRTKPLSEWRQEINEFSHVVPSPMSNRTGINAEGKRSHRCLGNTGPRKFLVVEFDTGSWDSQASKLWHLRQWTPLVLVVWSGGKSLHGWFLVDGKAEEQIRPFMELAVSIGGDEHSWSRCQLMRMPAGLRDNGKRQSVLYFDGKPINFEPA